MKLLIIIGVHLIEMLYPELKQRWQSVVIIGSQNGDGEDIWGNTDTTTP